MGVVVRRYIDILTIIINFPYSTCISSFFASSIPTSLFIFKMFFRSLEIKLLYYIELIYYIKLMLSVLHRIFQTFLNLRISHTWQYSH